MDAKAYTEVYNIITLMSDEYKEKIPNKIIEAIKYKMDKSYDFNIDIDNIENIELMEDTEKILSVIYTDYLSSQHERRIIKNKEKIIMLKDEERNKQRYSNDVFTNQINSNRCINSKTADSNMIEERNNVNQKNKIIEKDKINGKDKKDKNLLNFIKKLLKN